MINYWFYYFINLFTNS